jgi:hypothetical protein
MDRCNYAGYELAVYGASQFFLHLLFQFEAVSLCVGYALGIPYVGALARCSESLPLAFFDSAFYPLPP